MEFLIKTVGLKLLHNVHNAVVQNIFRRGKHPSYREERDRLEDLGVEGMIRLKCILVGGGGM